MQNNSLRNGSMTLSCLGLPPGQTGKHSIWDVLKIAVGHVFRQKLIYNFEWTTATVGAAGAAIVVVAAAAVAAAVWNSQQTTNKQGLTLHVTTTFVSSWQYLSDYHPPAHRNKQTTVRPKLPHHNATQSLKC